MHCKYNNIMCTKICYCGERRTLCVGNACLKFAIESLQTSAAVDKNSTLLMEDSNPQILVAMRNEVGQQEGTFNRPNQSVKHQKNLQESHITKLHEQLERQNNFFITIFCIHL